MFALTDLLSFSIQTSAVNTFVSVTVTLASGTNSDISDGIEIRFQHLFVAEQFISEGVQSSQRDSDVGCCDPLLELDAMFKVVGTWPTLQG
jgi:hypothetical protein